MSESGQARQVLAVLPGKEVGTGSGKEATEGGVRREQVGEREGGGWETTAPPPPPAERPTERA